MQPLGALSGHLTKLQPQKKFISLQNLSVEHLQCMVSVKFRVSEIQFSGLLSFSSEMVVDLDSAPMSPCSLSPPPYSCTARASTNAGGGFAGASGRHGADDATQRRPNQPPKPAPVVPRAPASRGRMRCGGGLTGPYYSHHWPGHPSTHPHPLLFCGDGSLTPQLNR